MTAHARKPYTPPADTHSIRVESTGNAIIVDRTGRTVGVLEDWTLFVDGKRITDVDNYRDAVQWTAALENKRLTV